MSDPSRKPPNRIMTRAVMPEAAAMITTAVETAASDGSPTTAAARAAAITAEVASCGMITVPGSDPHRAMTRFMSAVAPRITIDASGNATASGPEKTSDAKDSVSTTVTRPATDPALADAEFTSEGEVGVDEMNRDRSLAHC